MQDSALLLSGHINAANVIVPQSVAGINQKTLSEHCLDLGNARDIGEGRPLFLKVVSAAGAVSVPSVNYTAYKAETDYVRGEKCSFNGNDYTYIASASTKGHAPPDSQYWELVPDSVEIQLIAATDEALTKGLIVLTTSGPVIVYPKFVASTVYKVGDKVTYLNTNYSCIDAGDYPVYVDKDYDKDDKVAFNGKAYQCIKDTTSKQPPTDSKGVLTKAYWKTVLTPNPANPDFWDAISSGISDGFTLYLPIPPQLGARGKRYLGVRYYTIGNVTGASFTAEITTEVSDPLKFYASGFKV